MDTERMDVMTLFGDNVVTQIVKRTDGFYWPADDDWCYKVIHDELPDLDTAVALTRGNALAVQAGGNVGVWAWHLAGRFAQVVTVEPDAANYECLTRNVPANVTYWRAGFGAEPGLIGLVHIAGNAGAHFAKPDGNIPVMTIDSLNLPACDLLCLDIEGSEPAALRGAEQTIRKYKPVIMFEEKGLSERYYGIPRGTAEAWVLGLGLGYRVRTRVRADVILSV
jgi:FkbM family methyltransferase